MKTALLIYIATLLIFLPLGTAQAQTLGAASTYSISDKDAITGDLIADRPGKGFIRSDVTYDSRLFGVLDDNPLMVFRKVDQKEDEKAIVRAGDADVNVTDFSGEIKAGDYVTTSPIPGKGMKAVQSGYVIGLATADMEKTGTITQDGKTYNVGHVNVAVRIEYAEITTARNANRLFDQLNAAFFKNVQDPEKFTLVIRYIIAGIVSLITLFFAFFAFTRSIAKGVEAIGRNPLAKRDIQISIGLQIILSIATALIGLVIAFIIIRV